MDGQGIDTSIYGNLQTPQPANLLGMGMQGAYMANAMNQNRMFQLQMQARQGMADLAQRHMNSDGTMDYEGFGQALFQDPRTALLAPQTLQTLYQNGLINAQMMNAQLDVKQKQMTNLANSLGNLLPLGDKITQKDIYNELASNLPYGTFTTAEAANLMTHMPDDQKDAQGNVIGNPQAAQYIRTFANQFKESRDAFNNFQGTWQTISTPQGTYGGRFSQVTGNFTPTTQFGQGEPQTVQSPMGGEREIPLGSQPGFQGGVTQFQQPGNPFTQPSAVGPTGQNPGVAPGQVTTGGLAPPPGPNTNPADVDRAVLMLGQRESGLQNIPNKQGGPDFGYFQIIPPTWKEGLQLAGMDPNLDIHKASFDQQFQVAKALYTRYGEAPWQSSHGMSGPLPQGTQQPATASPGGGVTMAPNLTPSQTAAAQGEQGALQQQVAQEPAIPGGGGGGTAATRAAVSAAGQQTAAQGPAAPQIAQANAPQQPPAQAPQQPGFYSKNPPVINDMLQGKGKYGDYESALKAQVDQDGVNNRVIGEMENALRTFQSGRGATAFMEAGRLAETVGQALGMDKDTLNNFVQGISRGDVSAMQEFMKLAAPQAISQVRVAEGPNSKITNMVGGVFLQTQPNLEMDPNAIHRMFNFSKKVQQMNQAQYQAWMSTKQQVMQHATQAGGWSDQDVQRLDQFAPKFQKALQAEGYLNYDPVKDQYSAGE